MMPAAEWDIAAGDVTLHATAYGGHEPAAIVVSGGPGVSHDYALGLAALAGPDLRLVFYDQRGTGRSTAPAAERWGLDAYVDDLEALRASLGLERPPLIGHSWGGMVALAYAGAYPERIGRLLLVDSGAATAGGLETMQRHFDDRLATLARTGTIAPERPAPAGDDGMPIVRWLNPAYFADPEHPEGRRPVGTCSMRAQDGSFAALGSYDLRPGARRLLAPVLIIHGEKDPFGLEVVEELASALPQARTVVLPGCGHIPWHESGEAFGGVARSFLLG